MKIKFNYEKLTKIPFFVSVIGEQEDNQPRFTSERCLQESLGSRTWRGLNSLLSGLWSSGFVRHKTLLKENLFHRKSQKRTYLPILKSEKLAGKYWFFFNHCWAELSVIFMIDRVSQCRLSTVCEDCWAMLQRTWLTPLIQIHRKTLTKKKCIEWQMFLLHVVVSRSC